MPMRHSKPFGGPHRPPANARKWCLCSMNWEVLKKVQKKKLRKEKDKKIVQGTHKKKSRFEFRKLRTNIQATFPKLSLPLWIFHVFLVLFLIDIQTSALGIPNHLWLFLNTQWLLDQNVLLSFRWGRQSPLASYVGLVPHGVWSFKHLHATSAFKPSI